MKEKNGLPKNATPSLHGIGEFMPGSKKVNRAHGKGMKNNTKHPYLREGFIFPCCNKKDHEK